MRVCYNVVALIKIIGESPSSVKERKETRERPLSICPGASDRRSPVF